MMVQQKETTAGETNDHPRSSYVNIWLPGRLQRIWARRRGTMLSRPRPAPLDLCGDHRGYLECW